ILPRIQNAISAPHLAPHLYIVGQKPHPRLAPLRDNPAITITGWVDSVKPYLQAADVYIAPLRMGSGTRLKLLEAMASGCAVVATSAAAAGLLSEPKNAMIITDTESEMAEAVVNLLKNPTQCRELGEQARHAVRQHYDWQVLIPRLLAAYGEMGLG
ncbi:MAG: glycosyltransferase, partial [Anaerolineae bacterium]|nr:glycosyltransferase [Anaerolineae bacterium]